MMTSVKLVGLILALTMTFVIPASAQSISVTGSNGGTFVGNRDCARGGGQATCTTASVATGPKGATTTRNRTRVTSKEGSNITFNRTGPFGKTHTRNTTISR